MHLLFHLLLSCLWIVVVVVGQYRNCNRELCSDKVKFWLETKKDMKNKWTTNTGIEHPKKPGELGWNIQVDNGQTNCDGEDYCRVMASITAICPDNTVENDDYVKHPTGRYKLHLFNMTSAIWSTGKTICENEGGHLAVVNSDEEFEIIKRIVMDKCPWIGVSVKNGDYFDVFGNYARKYWAAGFPEKRIGCACISSEGMKDNDACNVQGSFLCEKALI